MVFPPPPCLSPHVSVPPSCNGLMYVFPMLADMAQVWVCVCACVCVCVFVMAVFVLIFEVACVYVCNLLSPPCTYIVRAWLVCVVYFPPHVLTLPWSPMYLHCYLLTLSCTYIVMYLHCRVLTLSCTYIFMYLHYHVLTLWWSGPWSWCLGRSSASSAAWTRRCKVVK